MLELANNYIKKTIIMTAFHMFKKLNRDFPCGPVVKIHLAMQDTGLILGRGTKVSHATGQLSSHATTREPVHLSERSRDALNTPHAATKTQHSQISTLLKS